MNEALLEALRSDLSALVNCMVIVREFDNEETQGTILEVGQGFVTLMDETDKRVVRLRVDQIRSVDDPPQQTESTKGKSDDTEFLD